MSIYNNIRLQLSAVSHAMTTLDPFLSRRDGSEIVQTILSALETFTWGDWIEEKVAGGALRVETAGGKVTVSDGQSAWDADAGDWDDAMESDINIDDVDETEDNMYDMLCALVPRA